MFQKSIKVKAYISPPVKNILFTLLLILVICSWQFTYSASYATLSQEAQDRFAFFDTEDEVKGKSGKIRIEGECIPDDTDLSNVLEESARGKPMCSEVDKIYAKEEQVAYDDYGWKIYYDKDGKRLPYQDQVIINTCMSLDTPHKKILKDINLIKDMYVLINNDVPRNACMTEAATYFVINGWEAENVEVDESGKYMTITLVPDNSTST